MNRFASKKLLAFAASVVGAFLVNIVGLPVEVANQLTQAISTLGMTYLGAQGAVDAVREFKGKGAPLAG